MWTFPRQRGYCLPTAIYINAVVARRLKNFLSPSHPGVVYVLYFILECIFLVG